MGIDWDTKIPIGLILGMVGQTIVIIFGVTVWGVILDTRVADLEIRAEANEPYVQRFILLEERVNALRESVVMRLDRTEDRLERLERLRGIWDSPRDSRRIHPGEEEE